MFVKRFTETGHLCGWHLFEKMQERCRRVGAAGQNLALSDRRAESVALALTEYFDSPPENMIVQGYGETELLIDTQANEPANRRVEVKVITPLMKTTYVE